MQIFVDCGITASDIRMTNKLVFLKIIRKSILVQQAMIRIIWLMLVVKVTEMSGIMSWGRRP